MVKKPTAKLILALGMLAAAFMVMPRVARADRGGDCVAWCQQCTECPTGYCVPAPETGGGCQCAGGDNCPYSADLCGVYPTQ